VIRRVGVVRGPLEARGGRGEADPLLDLVVAQAVEAEPVAVLADTLRVGDGPPDEARAHVLLAAVDEFAREQEAAGGLPGRVQVDDPARIAGVAGLLRAPEGADAAVEHAVSRDGREADAAAEALVLVVVVEGIVRGLALPPVHDPGLRVEPWRELIGEGEAGAALRPAELKDLRRRRREVEDLVVALEPERQVEAGQRDRQTVADRRD